MFLQSKNCLFVFITGGIIKKGSQDVKIPLKVLIVASHRTGSSLLGDILSYSRQGYINRYKIIDNGVWTQK